MAQGDDAPNPVLERIARLTLAWTLAAEDPALRVVVWRVTPEEARLVDAFVKVEGTEHGATPDLFLPCDAPFEGPAAYVGRLGAALEGWWAADRAALEAERLAAGWAPSRDEALSSLGAACVALAEAAPPGTRHVVWVLQPTAITDPAGWRTWLATAAATSPPRVRYLVLDDAARPLTEGIEGPGLHLERQDLEYDAMVAAAARAVGRPGPGKDYQVAFADLVAAARRGDLGATEEAAGRALEVCAAQGWPGLACAVHLARASTLQNTERTDDAGAAYQAAASLARAATAAGDPTGPRLEATAALSHAGLLLAARRPAQAASLAEQALPLARVTGDAVLAVEASRVAAWAWDEAGEPEAASRMAEEALVDAARLPAADRARSSAPYAGIVHLRATAGTGRPVEPVRRAWDDLLGPGWAAGLGG